MFDDSEGWLDIALAGEEKPHRIDLFEANDTFLAAYKGIDADSPPADTYAALRKAAADLGFGEVSSRTAQAIEQAVFARMDDLRKKDSPAATTP